MSGWILLLIILLLCGGVILIVDHLLGYSSSIRVAKGFLSEKDKEYRQVDLDVERRLVLLKEENSNKYKNLSKTHEDKLGLLNIFESITDDLNYDGVCNLIGSRGILQAQSGNKKSYMWHLGYYAPNKYDDIETEQKIDRYLWNICKVCLFIGIFVILTQLLFSSIYISQLDGFESIIQIIKGISSIMLATSVVKILCLFLGIYIIRQFVSILINLRKISCLKLEEVYIKVSFNDDKVLSKEQRGLTLD